MTNQECLNLFEAHLRDEKNASSNTLESYMRDIRQFADYLGGKTDSSLSSATDEDVESYISSLRQSGKSVATVSRSIASIKNFYMQLCIKKVLSHSPAMGIKPEKAEVKTPEILTGEEIDLLLKQPRCIDAKGYRDHAMLEVLYATGMRVSELLDLNLSDVNLDDEMIRCHSKGRDRLVPIYPEAVKALSDYLDLVRPQMVTNSDEPALFVNVSGERMSRQGFWKILKFYSNAAGIKKDITPQTLRHSFATHLLENGADMHAIQDLMGFSDIASAQLYTKLLKNNVKDVYKNSHPRAIAN